MMKNTSSAKLADHADSTIFSLIDEVQKYQFLYDIQRHQRSATELVARRCEVWNEISLLFGLPAAECLALWNRLRSTFSRNFRIYQASKYTDKPYNPNNWKYFDSLLFLIPYIDYSGQAPTDLSSSANGTTYSQLAPSGHTAVTSLAKKAIKRSKNILLKTKDIQRTTEVNESDISTFDISRLIILVKQHAVLYEDTGNRSNFRGKELSRAWQMIASSMGCTVNVCLTKWKSLWVNLRKFGETPRGHKWKWFSQMQFFIPYQKARARPKVTENYDGNKSIPVRLEFDSNNQVTGKTSELHTTNPEMANKPTDGWYYNGPDDQAALPAMETDETSTSVMTPQSNTSSTLYKSHVNGGMAAAAVVEPKYSEYYFGMCVAQMMEEVPKSARPLLKAKILNTVATSMK